MMNMELALRVLCTGTLTLSHVAARIDGHPMSSVDLTLLSFLGNSSFATDSAIDIIVNEYTTTSYPDISERLDNTIEAIELCETDGEPIQLKDHDFLYVGSIGASRNEASLQEQGITHIFNWSHSARCNLFDNIEYECITDVSGSEGMMSHLDELDKHVDSLNSVIKNGGRVLVHCFYGKNRSVTHLIAYLMKYEGMTAVDANELIKETRPKAKPYFEVLEAYASHLENMKNESVEDVQQQSTMKSRVVLSFISLLVIVVIAGIVLGLVLVGKKSRKIVVGNHNIADDANDASFGGEKDNNTSRPPTTDDNAINAPDGETQSALAQFPTSYRPVDTTEEVTGTDSYPITLV